MGVRVNVGGTWKSVVQPYVNIGGTWKKVDKIFVNVGGSWKIIFMRQLIYAVLSGNTLFKYDTTGGLVQSFSTTGTYIAVDQNGYMYVCGNGTGKLLQKLTPTGSQVWSITLSGTPGMLAVDSNGYVYITVGNTLYKYNSNGSVVWSQSYGGYIDLDSAGNIYVASGSTVKKINSSGSQVWSYTSDLISITSIAVTANGVSVIAGYKTTSEYGGDCQARAISSSGSLLWGTTSSLSYNGAGVERYSSAVDADYVYLGYTRGTGSTDAVAVKLRLSDGAVVVSVYMGSAFRNALSITSLAVDPYGYVYIAQQYSLGKYNNSINTRIWSATLSPIDYRVYGLAVSPGRYGAFSSYWNSIK
jgi:hypothetical protein